MERIFKYPLKFEDEQVVEIHGLIRVFSVIEQNGVLMLYAMVNNDNHNQMCHYVKVFIRGTGHNMNGAEEAWFLGTVPTTRGLVWHVFYLHVFNGG